MTVHEAGARLPEPLPQGDVGLLETDTAQRLLASPLLARLAYIALDGTPRVMPTWFHWTGDELVMPTYVSAPHIRHPAARLRALRAHPRVAVTVDTELFPQTALNLRGDVTVVEQPGVVEEYALAARRYLGEDGSRDLLAMIDHQSTTMARIALRPSWVGLIDFQTRLPGPLGGVLPPPDAG